MTRQDPALRAGGTWLAAASALMFVALSLHGRIDPDLAVQLRRVASSPGRWALVHWTAAASLALYAVSGLIILTSRSRLTHHWATTSAWAVVAVGATATLMTAVSETTVLATAAAAGDAAMFASWWAFAEGLANGFAFLGLAVAVIAVHEARSDTAATPPWAARVASAAGVVAFTGWVLGSWIGLPAGAPLWLSGSLVMVAWTAWLGVGLVRQPLPRRAEQARPTPAQELAAGV